MGPEIAQSIYGALRLARFDRAGFAWFNRTLEGFWHSYYAALLGFPIYLLSLGVSVPDASWQRAEPFRIYLVESIGYVIFWAGYPLLMLPILRLLGRERRAFDFFVPYNWAQFLELALLLFINALLAAGIVPRGMAVPVLLVLQVAILVYEGFIARFGLDLQPPAAALIVAILFLFNLVIHQVADGLL
jgi:hypothetical protein